MNNIDSYQKLQNWVQGGQLELIHVIGLPRSNGTAVHLALTQAKEVAGQLNEPFYYPDLKGRIYKYKPTKQDPAVRTFEDGCGHIVKRYEDAIAKNTQLKKVTLVVHDLSQDLTADEFRKLVKIQSHVIFVIREPSKQGLSLLTRYANDKLSQPGGNKLKSADVLKIMQNASALKTYATNKKTAEVISLDMVKKLIDKKDDKPLSDQEWETARCNVLEVFREEYTIAWDNLKYFHKMIQKDHPNTVFDADWLFENPETHLKALSDRIGTITYDPSMIDNWTKGIGDQFQCVITRNWGDLAKTNAWNGPARNSKGIPKQTDSVQLPVQAHQFPSEVRNQVQMRLSMYTDLLAKTSPQAVGPSAAAQTQQKQTHKPQQQQQVQAPQKTLQQTQERLSVCARLKNCLLAVWKAICVALTKLRNCCSRRQTAPTTT